MSAVRVITFISVPITVKVIRATRAIFYPPSDIIGGQVGMLDIVSRIDDAYFHVLSGSFSPERADIDHVDAPSLGYASLYATIKNLSIMNVSLKVY